MAGPSSDTKGPRLYFHKCIFKIVGVMTDFEVFLPLDQCFKNSPFVVFKY